MVAILNPLAYRLLRDLRKEGRLSWPEMQQRIQDHGALESAIDWLQDRALVAIDEAGVRCP